MARTPEAVTVHLDALWPFSDRRPTWEEYALLLAQTAALRSQDLNYKVGAALMRHDHTVAGLGYNGAPSGVEIDWGDREGRRGWVQHAESNALRYVRPGEVELLASTLMPCGQCMLMIAGYDIKRVVYRGELDPSVYDRDATLDLAIRCGIEVYKMTDGSLDIQGNYGE